MTVNNNITFNDILQYEIIRSKYQVIMDKLKDKNISVLKETLKEIIEFIKKIKGLALDRRLKNLIKYQQKLAKKLLLIINIRYIIFFIYKIILQKLIAKLYESIRIFITEIEKIIKY